MKSQLLTFACVAAIFAVAYSQGMGNVDEMPDQWDMEYRKADDDDTWTDFRHELEDKLDQADDITDLLRGINWKSIYDGIKKHAFDIISIVTEWIKLALDEFGNRQKNVNV